MSRESISPEKNKEWLIALANTQLQGIEEAREILYNVLQMGISSIDIEYREEICYYVESLIDFNIPGLLREFRHFFSILYYADNPSKYPEIIAQMNRLMIIVEEARAQLMFRIEVEYEINTISTLEESLGYMWRRMDFLEHKQFEEDVEIVQLSFGSYIDEEKPFFTDEGFWMNLKTGKIYQTRRRRPRKAAKFVKADNSVFDVLHIDRLFVYPGRINNRIRWDKEEKREMTPQDIRCVLDRAESDYAAMTQRMKQHFREPLFVRTPVLVIKLHKSYLSGDYLILEDEHGAALTVMDATNDDFPTADLLQAILPAQLTDSALLVQVNDDVDLGVFSVKPLSIITPEKIIRLLF